MSVFRITSYHKKETWRQMIIAWDGKREKGINRWWSVGTGPLGIGTRKDESPLLTSPPGVMGFNRVYFSSCLSEWSVWVNPFCFFKCEGSGLWST
ncbi:hypothetical protein TNCV_460351 [Trichonephila clavipes]|nr:hypothetical protein TNCV_460351 [Trichonephila clavipes]